MEMNEIITLITNNSVAVAMIAYFAVRDWKFQSTLQATLTTLVDSVDAVKELIKEVKKGD